jgi:hypothetical protein
MAAMGGFATFPAGFPRFFGIKLMRGSLFVSRFSTFARNFALFILVHGSKTALAGTAAAFC